LIEQALEMRRRLLGERHSLIAHTLNTLGAAKMQLGDMRGAEAAHRDALTMFRDTFGSAHSQVAESLRKLGETLMKSGNPDAAESLLVEAISIRRQLGGERTQRMAIDLNVYATLLRRRGAVDAAERAFQEAIEILRGNTPDHPDLTNCLYNLAELYRAQKRFSQAAPILREVVGRRRARLPEGRVLLSTALFSLGATLRGLGELAEAENALRESLATIIDLHGQYDPRSARVRMELAGSLADQTRWDEADPMMDAALSACLAAPQPGRERYIEEFRALLETWSSNGRNDAADRWRRQLDQRDESSRPP
jgi:tetratricopeptide (TPR) repeat protein